MFKEGYILYFTPFYFKNGSEPRNKYFLVIKNEDDKLLLASLPTSKDHIPSDFPLQSGCCEIPEKGVSAYIFVSGTEIATEPSTMARFAFPRNTYIYGEQVDTYPVKTFREQLKKGLISVKIVGILDSEIISDIKEFLKNSCTVRGKLKKMLTE